VDAKKDELAKQYLQELIDFTYFYNETTRNVQYRAPAGQHDDCVMSLALASWAKKVAFRSTFDGFYSF
jgi:hypothetical protein